MKKKPILGVFLLSIIFFLVFGNVAKAQVTTSYIGVSEGDEFTWKVDINFEGVDTLVTNIREVMVDQQNKLNELVLFGFEDLTINETIESIAYAYISNILPAGWETYNLSTLFEMTIKDYVEKFNSTIFSGFIPANWESLNFSTFYDYIVDGINATMGVGWEGNPIPGLLEIMVNELNSSVLFGFIPEGWENLTIEEIILISLEMNVPDVLESFMLNRMLSDALQVMFPPEFINLSMEEILTMQFDPLGLNATFLFEQFFLGINSTFPSGMESENVSVIIDFINTLLNSTLPEGYDSLSVATLLDIGIDEYLYLSIPPYLHNLTLKEIISVGLNQSILGYDVIITEWEQILSTLQGSGLSGYEFGLNMTIDHIGTIESVFPGGPQGVNLNVSLYFSLDFEYWVDLSLMFTGVDPLYFFMPFSLVVGPLIDLLSGETMVFDPSSYSNIDTAIVDQIMYSGGLIVANNYDWASTQTDFTIETALDPNCIEASIAWNNNGILRSATINASGVEVASFTLIEEIIPPDLPDPPDPLDPPDPVMPPEIPGYEVTILIGISSATLIAIIYHMKRKNNIIK